MHQYSVEKLKGQIKGSQIMVACYVGNGLTSFLFFTPCALRF